MEDYTASKPPTRDASVKCAIVFVSHLLLFQGDDRAVTAAAPLPLEGSDLFCLYSQDLLLLLILYLQLLRKRYENNQVH